MTDAESDAICRSILEEIGEWETDPWVYFWSKKQVCLDGDFSKRELEIIAKHMEDETSELLDAPKS